MEDENTRLGPRPDAVFEAATLPYLRPLFRLALRLAGDATTAEDLVQETYLRALQSFPALRESLIEEIPLPDSSVDVVVSNGVLNLSTRKSRVLAEAGRVLRPGGRVSIADLVLDQALPEDVLKSPAALAG